MIRVVVGEDQPIFRDGLVHVLSQGGFDVVGTAGDAAGLVRQIQTHRPDIAIADIQMPPDRTDDGLRAVVEARANQEDLCILLLSQFLDVRYVTELMADGAGGVGYLLKEKVAEVATFLDAVERVASGGTALDPDVVGAVVGRRRRPGSLDDLTKRERQVLSLIAEGKSNSGIASSWF